MRLTLSLAAWTLLWISLLLSLAWADQHSHFDYRGHHAEAAAIVNGHGGNQDYSHQAPRIREKFVNEQQEPERWAQYIPHTSKSIAEEMSEARRHAREEESKKIQAERQEQEQKVKQEAEEARQARIEVEKKRSNKNSKTQSALKKAAQNVKSATKRTTKKAQAKAEHWLELDDEDDEDGDDDEEGSTYRRSKRSSTSNGIRARIWGALRWVLGICYLSIAWSGRNLIWIPSKYVVHGIRWSAKTSWRTTRWTGERAFVGPALTVGAPVIYLGEGFLFLFVWTPARIASVIARELYPIYIFLGAALAVGTAMGIASAIILYIGSFFLSDSSTMEAKVSQRAEMLPNDLQKRIRVKKSAAKKWARTGGSVIEQAIQESLDKSQQKQRDVETEESEEDEDYFGLEDTSTTSFKGKGRSTSDQLSSNSTSARRTPTHFGPPLPIGATGWNHSRSDSTSSTSSPATSPTSLRTFSNGASTIYGSAKSKLSASPLTSPDVFRSRSSRQRRDVRSSL